MITHMVLLKIRPDVPAEQVDAVFGALATGFSAGFCPEGAATGSDQDWGDRIWDWGCVWAAVCAAFSLFFFLLLILDTVLRTQCCGPT